MFFPSGPPPPTIMIVVLLFVILFQKAARVSCWPTKICLRQNFVEATRHPRPSVAFGNHVFSER